MAINPFVNDVLLAAPRNGNGQIDDPVLERIRREAEAGKDPSPSTRSATVTQPLTSLDSISSRFDVTRIPLSRLKQMRRDPMIAFALFFILAHLLSARWRCESKDARAAAFVDRALRDIFAEFVGTYLEKLAYGYQATVKSFEATYPDWTYLDVSDPEDPEKKVWDQGVIKAVIWKPFTGIPPEMASPAWTEDGSFNGINYAPSPYSNMEGYDWTSPQQPAIPLENSLWFSNDKASVFNSLWGYPRVGPAYRPWWSFWFVHGLLDRHFEQDADPPVKVWFPANKASTDGVTNRDKALQIGDRARSGSVIALPSDVVQTMDGRQTNLREWDVEFLKGGGNFEIFKDRFDQLQVFILRACMFPEDAVAAKGGTAGYNSTSNLLDVFQLSQTSLAEDIDFVVNRYMIPQLLALNGFGDVTVKKVTYGMNPVDVEIGKTLLQGAANSSAMSLGVDYETLMEMFGVPKLSFDALQEEQKRRVEKAKNTLPEPTQPSTNGTAGITADGLYYDSRNQIVLSSSNPFLVNVGSTDSAG